MDPTHIPLSYNSSSPMCTCGVSIYLKSVFFFMCLTQHIEPQLMTAAYDDLLGSYIEVFLKLRKTVPTSVCEDLQRTSMLPIY